jgi:hypothetical protein
MEGVCRPSFDPFCSVGTKRRCEIRKSAADAEAAQCSEGSHERSTQLPERGDKLTCSDVGCSLFGPGPSAFCRVDHDGGEHLSSFGSSGALQGQGTESVLAALPAFA